MIAVIIQNIWKGSVLKISHVTSWTLECNKGAEGKINVDFFLAVGPERAVNFLLGIGINMCIRITMHYSVLNYEV